MMDQTDLPLGFTFALAQDPKAMQVFAELPKAEQAEYLQKAHTIRSKDEIRDLIRDLSART